MNFYEACNSDSKFIKCDHPSLKGFDYFDKYHLFGVFLHTLTSMRNWEAVKKILIEGDFSVADDRMEWFNGYLPIN